MRKSLNIICLSVLCVVLAFGQDVSSGVPRFSAARESTSDTAEAVTLQLAANSPVSVLPLYAVIQCSVDCTVSQKIGGTAATATAITPVALAQRETAVAAVAAAYHSSNVGVGSSVAADIAILADAVLVIDLSGHIFMTGRTSVSNLTISTASSSAGTHRITIIWQETR